MVNVKRDFTPELLLPSSCSLVLPRHSVASVCNYASLSNITLRTFSSANVLLILHLIEGSVHIRSVNKDFVCVTFQTFQYYAVQQRTD